jgi:4-hydroxybenzoate polyprenyltransferase
MYKKALKWIKAGRPLSVALGVILTLAAANVGQVKLTPWIPIFIAIAGMAIMVQNDWRDRYHDLKKGKTFVITNESSFLLFTISLWIISAVLITIIWTKDTLWGITAGYLTLMGFVYSEARTLPIAPGLIVSQTAAGAVLFSFVKNPQPSLVLLYLATMFFIWGRETLKDIDDVDIDSGYKWTFPVNLGIKKSMRIVMLMYTVALFLMLFVSCKALFGIPLLLASVIMMIMEKNHKLTKRIGDLGIALILISLLV